METITPTIPKERAAERKPETAAPQPFEVSNAILLSGRQLIGLGLLAALVFLFAPRVWERIEPFDFANDYRIPYEQASDYWWYERLAHAAEASGRIVLMGDSVVWGQYVTGAQTLSHYLNTRAGDRFANLGLDGAHPAALAGLIEYHAAAIANRKVIVQCNPLWMSSPRHDLAGRDEFRFNHPALVPQFFPSIPCYREEMSRRIGFVLERNAPYYTWVNHIQISRFGQTSIPEWTLEHPYENPVAALLKQPAYADREHEQPMPWTQRGVTVQELPWVELETSFQWRSFKRAIEVLKQRGNRVMVIVGPFNTHLLNEASRAVYSERAKAIRAHWEKEGVACVAPETLPSQLYADASHPLAEGYDLLAKNLLATRAFAYFIGATMD